MKEVHLKILFVAQRRDIDGLLTQNEEGKEGPELEKAKNKMESEIPKESMISEFCSQKHHGNKNRKRSKLGMEVIEITTSLKNKDMGKLRWARKHDVQARAQEKCLGQVTDVVPSTLISVLEAW